MLGRKPDFIPDRERGETDDDGQQPLQEYELMTAKAAVAKAYSLELVDKRLRSELQRIMVQEEQLARDLALFGDTHQDAIMEAYNITPEGLLSLLEDPKFSQRVQALRAELASDTKGLIRARAAMYLEAGLDSAYEISCDPSVRATDRIKAIQFLALMADAIPKTTGVTAGEGGVAGVNIMFSFGQQHPRRQELEGIVTAREVTDD